MERNSDGCKSAAKTIFNVSNPLAINIIIIISVHSVVLALCVGVDCCDATSVCVIIHLSPAKSDVARDIRLTDICCGARWRTLLIGIVGCNYFHCRLVGVYLFIFFLSCCCYCWCTSHGHYTISDTSSDSLSTLVPKSPSHQSIYSIESVLAR